MTHKPVFDAKLSLKATFLGTKLVFPILFPNFALQYIQLKA